MTIARRRRSWPMLVAIIVALAVAGCASPAPTAAPPSPSGTATAPTAVPPGSTPPSATPGPRAAPFGPNTSFACISLDPDDCARAASIAASALMPGDGAVVYVQVGPFGCPGGNGCPRTLAARPIAVHIEAAGADPTVTREVYFGISLEPSSGPAPATGPVPYSLGHCGLWSGIDIDGSWWYPVGSIDGDHGDSINAADGTIIALDRDHATFTSAGGFIASIQRRIGPKYLPLCA